MFLNDLEEFMISNGATGLNSLSSKFENDLNMYLNLFVLLYADDTVLMSETPEDLQKQLNIFHDYCSYWHLKVNVEKTKVVVFGKRYLGGFFSVKLDRIITTLNNRMIRL